MKKAPAHTATKAPDEAYCTSKRGRRAIASLWNASRTVSGALLTDDDLALITEALTEIRSAMLEGAK